MTHLIRQFMQRVLSVEYAILGLSKDDCGETLGTSLLFPEKTPTFVSESNNPIIQLMKWQLCI